MSEADKYLSKVDAPQRAELERIRKIIKKVVPDAEEVMSYGIPTFKYKNKNLFHYAAFKDHLSIFPGPEAITKLKGQLGSYKISKGTIQFTPGKPIPESILIEVVKNRAQAIQELNNK